MIKRLYLNKYDADVLKTALAKQAQESPDNNETTDLLNRVWSLFPAIEQPKEEAPTPVNPKRKLREAYCMGIFVDHYETGSARWGHATLADFKSWCGHKITSKVIPWS